jgi:uncharacterized protein
MRSLLAFFLAVISFSLQGQPASPAAQNPASDSPPSKEEVLRFFEVMQVRQQSEAVLASTEEQVKTMTRDMISRKAPTASPEQLAQLEGMLDTMFKEYPINSILDDMVPVYQKHLTKSDLNGLITFYSSPLGQKILREMPAMTSEAMQISYAHLQKNMESIMKKVDNRVQQIVDEQQKQKSKEKETSPSPKPE